MVSETDVATAALAVALVALVTTVSQLLGQFFATAEGYRRCQASVMGGWAKLTRRKFRWSELRFETIYTVPRFGIYPYVGSPVLLAPGSSFSKAPPYYLLDGTPGMVRNTHSHLSVSNKESVFDGPDASPSWIAIEKESLGGPDSLVSWVRFIEALHANSKQSLACSSTTKEKQIGQLEVVTTIHDVSRYDKHQGHTIPIIAPQERSWDFVPPDVIRPLAVISIGEIAILARRLGLVWKTFEPSSGLLQAEGNGHTLSSAIVRSMGTVLEISIQDPLTSDINELFVPSESADKLGFGIVPGQESLYVPDHRIGTEDEMKAIVAGFNTQALDQLKNINSSNPGWTPGISDIIGIAAPMIRLPGSTIIRVPQPAGYAAGLTQQEDGFVVFHNRLRDHIAEKDAREEYVSDQTRLILHQYEELLSKYGKQWESQHHSQHNKSSISFLDDLHAKRTATTQYFIGLQSDRNIDKTKGQRFCFIDLIYSHITHAINYFPVAMGRIRAQPSQARDTYNLHVADWIIEGSHVYFDNLSKVVGSMKERGFDNPRIVEEAWITMMFRAFLWHRSHFMVEGPRVPSQYWGSRLPVYIG